MSSEIVPFISGEIELGWEIKPRFGNAVPVLPNAPRCRVAVLPPSIREILDKHYFLKTRIWLTPINALYLANWKFQDLKIGRFFVRQPDIGVVEDLSLFISPAFYASTA